MEVFYFYLIAGIALIALELATTTFYLLVIGIASVIAGIVAFFIAGWFIPTTAVGLLSVIGCFIVAVYKKKSNNDGKMLVNHIGQSVEVVEIHPHNLRVFYSGTHWDARTTNIAEIKIGDKLKITKFSNNELEVE